MQSLFCTIEEVARRAKEFYENGIRQEVEHGDNIGKMITIDAETGEYGIDKTGIETAMKLKEKKPMARLFTMRIGYDVAVSFGGISLSESQKQELDRRLELHRQNLHQGSSWKEVKQRLGFDK